MSSSKRLQFGALREKWFKGKFFTISGFILLCIFALTTDVKALTASGLVGGSSITSTDGITNITNITDKTTITTNNVQYANTSVNWEKLNVGQNQTLDFSFSGLNQTVLNKVNTGMTTIAGQITNSGIGADTSRIIISNPNSMLLDSGGYINTNAIILTSLDARYNGVSSMTYSKPYLTLSPKGTFTTSPNTGVLIKGKIDTKWDSTIAGRGIRIEGGEITTGGNSNFITAEDVDLEWAKADIDSRNFTYYRNAGNLKLSRTGMWSVSSSNADFKNPMNLAYADGVKNPNNISITNNSVITAKNGLILLNDFRVNDKGINIESSTLIANNPNKGSADTYLNGYEKLNDIVTTNTNYIKIKDMTSNKATGMTLIMDHAFSSYNSLQPTPIKLSEVYLQDIKELKNINITNYTNFYNSNPYRKIEKLDINNVHTAEALSYIANSKINNLSITNASQNNDFAALKTNATEISAQKALANLALSDADNAYSASLLAVTAGQNAKDAKDVSAADKAYSDAKNAADAAYLAYLNAQAAADAAQSANTLIAKKAPSNENLKTTDRDSKANSNLQDALQAALDAKADSDKAANNASRAKQLAKDTKEIVLDEAPKNDVNKTPGASKNENKNLTMPNNNFLAQNIKSFAANERPMDNDLGKGLYKKTAQGFTIVEKIIR